MAIRLSTNRLDLGSAGLTNAEMRGWSETVNALGNVTGATTVDLSLGNVVTATTTGATTWTVTNASSSNLSSFTLILTNGGSQTQTWPSGTQWSQGVAPTLNSSGTDILAFFTTDGGTTWRGAKGGPSQADQTGQKLFVWGSNGSGYLGLGNTVTRSSPVQLAGQWAHASFSDYAACSLIKHDGSLWTTGYNANGALGLGDVANRSSPTQVAGTWILSHCGPHATFGVKTDNSLWGMGWSYRGQLGLGDTIKRSSPTQLAGTWKFALSAWNTSIAIRSDGSLWMWGDNSYGALGVNDGTSGMARSSPVQISGTWIRAANSSFATNDISSAAIKADGSLWTWGSKNYGMLGLGETTDHRSSPTQVPGTWREVSGGGRGTLGFLAIRHDGTLWTWGRNSYGEQGLGDQGVSRSSPTQIGTGTWLAIVASNHSRMAFKVDRSLWAWGKNTTVSLGVGDYSHRSSPTQIPGTWMHSGRDFFGAFGRGFRF